MINQNPGVDSTKVDSVNNLRAFRTIRVQLKKPDNTLVQIGLINNINAQSDTPIQIPISTKEDLKDQLINNAFHYVISGLADTTTTKIIKAEAIIQYKLRLAM